MSPLSHYCATVQCFCKFSSRDGESAQHLHLVQTLKAAQRVRGRILLQIISRLSTRQTYTAMKVACKCALFRLCSSTKSCSALLLMTSYTHLLLQIINKYQSHLENDFFRGDSCCKVTHSPSSVTVQGLNWFPFCSF